MEETSRRREATAQETSLALGLAEVSRERYRMKSVEQCFQERRVAGANVKEEGKKFPKRQMIFGLSLKHYGASAR